MITDELLAFASSRMNVVPFDVLVKLMSDSYTDEVVEASKQVLFETAFSNRNAEPPHQYSHKRRGQDKKSKNIQDIISVFLELPPHVTPSYVANDLSNLPPLNMNCFDVSALVKDIEALKLHVAVLHESNRVLLKAQLTSRPGESIYSQPEIRPELAARSPECGPEPQPPEHQTELETQPHTEPEMQQLTVPETQPQTEPIHERTRFLRLNIRHCRCLTNQLTSTAILLRMTAICAVSRQYNSQSPPGSDAVDKTIPSNRPSLRNNRGDSIHPRNDTATARW